MLPQGTYYLFYSGNNFDTAQYAISYATASAVGGPYAKHGPWLGSSAVFGSVRASELLVRLARLRVAS